MQKVLFFLMTLAFSSASFSAKKEFTDLIPLIELGLEKSFGIQTQRFRETNSEYLKENNFYKLFPTLSLSGGKTTEWNKKLEEGVLSKESSNSNTLSIRGEWTLWDNFDNITNIKTSRIEYQKSKIESDKVVQQFIVNLVEAYLELQLEFNKKRILTTRKKQSQWTFKKAKELVDLGAKTLIDVYNAEIDLANIDRDLLELENRVDNFQRKIRFLVNSKDPIQVNMKDFFTIQPYFMKGFEEKLKTFKEQLGELIPRNNRDVKVAELDRDKSRLDLKQKKLDHWPKLNVNLSHEWDFAGLVNKETSSKVQQAFKLEFGLTWDLWSWFSTTRNIQSTSNEFKIAQISLKEKIFEKRNELYNNLFQYDILKKSIEASELILKKAQAQQEYSNQMYTLGRITLLELQQATTKLFEAKNGLAQRLKDQFVLASKILFLIGEKVAP